MDVKIGVIETNRELTLETSQTSTEIEKIILAAMKDGSVFKLTDDKGRIIMVPVEKLAYIELGIPTERRVGFGAS